MRWLVIVLLLGIALTPVYAYNSGFRPVYQPNSPSGTNPSELYCTLNEFLNSYNSTTNSFSCGSPSAITYENNTASNVGLGEGIFKQKTGVNLEFKNISCSGSATCSSNATDITISSTGGASGEANTQSSPAKANSLVLTKSGVDLPIKGIACSGSATCSANSTDVTVDVSGLTDTNTAQIASAGGISLFKQRDNATQNTLKGLIATTGITLSSGVSTIDVSTNFKSNNISTTCSGTDKVSSISYDNQTGIETVTCTSDSTGSGPVTLSADVTCTATATYCTVFTIPLTTSKDHSIKFHLSAETNTAGATPQIRVRSDQAGTDGWCTITHYTAATTQVLDVLRITTASADDGETTWLPAVNTPQNIPVECAFKTGATPGNLILELQAEVASTVTVNGGSNYIMTVAP